MKEEQGYYAVIPAFILNSKISDRSKLLYGHISTLVKKEGYCWASNQFFERIMNCSQSTINRCFLELEKNGFITREVDFKEGKKEIEMRKIYLTTGIVAGDYRAIVKDESTNLTIGRSPGEPTKNDEKDENLGIVTGDLDNSTTVLLDSTTIVDNKEEIKVSYSSSSSTSRKRAEDTEANFNFNQKDYDDKLNSFFEEKFPDKSNSFSNMEPSIFDSITSNEAQSASEKESKVRQGCKPLEYILTDKERWAETEETKEREDCNLFLETLLEIWSAKVIDKEECMFGIFILSPIQREEAKLCLLGRVKFDDFRVGLSKIKTMDDFIKHQVKKAQSESLNFL